jgi:trehalose 6-phosphate phosphatase
MTTRARGVPNLLAQWDRVAAQVRAHRNGRIAIFLDFDGTLVDIAPRPELVALKPAARQVLRRLARHPRATVVVISGRRRAELLHHIGVRGIRYFGLYGSEDGSGKALPARMSATLQRARRELMNHLRVYPTAWIENKRSSLSVHLLDVPAKVQPRVRRQLRTWLNPFRKTLRAVENLRDVEILPRSVEGKGAAVRRFLAQPAHHEAFPFYFGDDLSDESGFSAVRRGVSVRVGDPRPGRATRAQYAVREPADTAAALAKLEGLLYKKSRQTSS